jgi:adenine phosphoribosyltransferase
MLDYRALIDTHTAGPRYDVTPLFADYAAFAQLVDDLCQQLGDVELDVVAGIDALGFILGTAIAIQRRVGFIPIRKGGKLPVRVDTAECVDYTGQRKTLELRKGALRSGMRALLVDEWIETGAQVEAAVSLITGQGGVIAGIAAINIDGNPRTRALLDRYRCCSVWYTI